MAGLQLRGVRKAFGAGQPVLEEIGFSVADGEFVSLLGPSGCGKTTLLRIIAGLESADSGSLRIEGREIGGDSPKDRDIAMVFQSYALYPHMDVRENIGAGLRLRGVPPQEVRQRVEAAAQRLGIAPLLERRPATLSGGQRQRVALARAMVRRPKLFLLDEPLSNLDALLRERTRGELKLLFKSVGGTVVYVTHDQVEAMTLSDRIVVLNRGRIQQIGIPEEIYRAPANTFVASFLGAPPMNLFPCEDAERLGLIPADAVRGDGRLCGIRPEDVSIAVEPGGGAPVELSLIEPTGAQTVLTAVLGGLTLRACVPGHQRFSGRRAFLRLPRERLHFFDAASGLRIEQEA